MRQPVFESAPPPETAPLAFATIVGLVAAIVGAVAWVVFTIATGYEVGFVAIGAAWLVGMAIRQFKASNKPIYGYLGAALSLLAIVGGDAGTVVAHWAARDRVDFLTELGRVAPGDLVQGMIDAGDVMTVVFFVIALIAGYRVAMGARKAPPQPRTPPRSAA